jgi:hypothetical protein
MAGTVKMAIRLCIIGIFIFAIEALAATAAVAAKHDLFDQALAATDAQPTPCRVAGILFGPISLDIIHYGSGAGAYESAIIRAASFDNPKRPFGAILGELTVDRGGFSVRTTEQEVVGTISPSLAIDGWDDKCATGGAKIIPVTADTFITMNNGQPVGTIKGNLPAHDFPLELPQK